MTLKTWTAAIAGVWLLGGAAAARADAGPPVRTEHLEARLAPQTVAAAPGSTFYVAVRQHIAPGWHTYWRNPGDSGEPTSIAWTLPAGWKAGEIVWPAPEHVATGPLTNYVFSGDVLLPVAIEAPASARPGDRVTLKAAVNWLVCKDVCIPGQALLTLDTTVAAGAPALDPGFGKAVSDTLARAPKPAGFTAAFQARGDAVTLAVTGEELRGADVSHAWFYPYAGDALDASKPQPAVRGPQGITFTLPAGYAFQHGQPPKELAGVVSLGPDRAWEVTAAPGPLPAGAAGLPGTGARAGAGGRGGAGVLLASLGAAFLGGLVLNLMPCVFPVLSIKAATLARHAGEPARARAEGLAYMGGVVGSFLALAGALIAVRAAGQEVGWGFQLQSPAVVAGLCLLMLLVALNLSGVFEVGGSVQGVGGGLAARGGLLGAVFTGALAVVVAAPCTAPFMAPAIGWALTQPPVAALSIFLALGLGLAAPLTLVSFTPALFTRLPRPGAWMEGLRHVLAFPMYATAGWLAWVFVAQAGVAAMPFLVAAGVALAFAAWAWGVGQRQERVLAPRVAALAGLIAAVPLVAQGAALGAGAGGPVSGSAASPAVAAAGSLPQEPWSPARVAELTAQGRPVFVDFTAAWCITCQVNERGALAGRGVADVFRRTGAVYLKADWTRRDAAIARALTEHGRSGVPLYLVYGPGEQAGRVLPQLLTEGLVVQALQAAAKRA